MVSGCASERGVFALGVCAPVQPLSDPLCRGPGGAWPNFPLHPAAHARRERPPKEVSLGVLNWAWSVLEGRESGLNEPETACDFDRDWRARGNRGLHGNQGHICECGICWPLSGRLCTSPQMIWMWNLRQMQITLPLDLPTKWGKTHTLYILERSTEEGFLLQRWVDLKWVSHIWIVTARRWWAVPNGEYCWTSPYVRIYAWVKVLNWVMRSGAKSLLETPWL